MKRVISHRLPRPSALPGTPWGFALVVGGAALFACSGPQLGTWPPETPSARSSGDAAEPSLARLYVGTSEGPVYVLSIDEHTGALRLVQSVDAGLSPSFLAVDRAGARLFAVNEGSAQVAAYRISAGTGELRFVNRVDSGGQSPAHLALDRSDRFVMVANYGGGNVRVLPVGADGRLGAPVQTRPTGKWAHMIQTDPSNHYVFVANKGADTLSQFLFDPTTGKLVANEKPFVRTAEGAGPRHFAFSPDGKYVFLINELDDTLSSYGFDASKGRLTWLQTLSTLPEGADGAHNTCAEVVVAPSGDFVYGSNRGDDSIATFALDAHSGKLRFLGTTPSGGAVPRSFTLSPDGRWMLVANESGNVTTFAVDVAHGSLRRVRTLPLDGKPQFVGWALIPQ